MRPPADGYQNMQTRKLVDFGLELTRFGEDDFKTIPPCGGFSHTQHILCVRASLFVLGSSEIVFSTFQHSYN